VIGRPTLVVRDKTRITHVVCFDGMPTVHIRQGVGRDTRSTPARQWRWTPVTPIKTRRFGK